MAHHRRRGIRRLLPRRLLQRPTAVSRRMTGLLRLGRLGSHRLMDRLRLLRLDHRLHLRRHMLLVVPPIPVCRNLGLAPTRVMAMRPSIATWMIQIPRASRMMEEALVLRLTSCFVLMTRCVLLLVDLVRVSHSICSGCARQEQMEMHSQRRHDPCQWQGLSLRQVHRVRTVYLCIIAT